MWKVKFPKIEFETMLLYMAGSSMTYFYIKIYQTTDTFKK